MSYILEALIQAQLERQCHGVPGLYTVQMLPRPRPATRPRWPRAVGGIAAVAVLGGLLTLAWMQPWHRELLEASAPPIVAASPGLAQSGAEAKPAVVSLATTPSLTPAMPMPEMQAPPEAAAILAKPDEPRRKHHRKGRKGKIRIATGKPGVPAAIRLYGIAELPIELQKVARSISIAGFADSDNPKERTAIINNRALREGDEVSGGLRVEEIAGNGVVFNLKGYRFRKGRT